MANENKPNNNRSQFFITLDQCPWLDKKHTIFGKIVGDTLYNLMAIGEESADEHERPLNPPVVRGAQIVLNPFDDIFPRDLPSKRPAKPVAPQKVQHKPVDNMSLLSFGDAEELATIEPKKTKLMSSHDALNDPSLSKEYAVSPEVLAKERERAKVAEEKREKLKQEILSRKKAEPPKEQPQAAPEFKEPDAPQSTPTENPVPVPMPVGAEAEKQEYAKFDEKQRAKMLIKRRQMDDLKGVGEEELDDPVVKAEDGGTLFAHKR